MKPQQDRIVFLPSFRRRPESRNLKYSQRDWTPVYTGVTIF